MAVWVIRMMRCYGNPSSTFHIVRGDAHNSTSFLLIYFIDGAETVANGGIDLRLELIAATLIDRLTHWMRWDTYIALHQAIAEKMRIS